jgi:hypothetical protein
MGKGELTEQRGSGEVVNGLVRRCSMMATAVRRPVVDGGDSYNTSRECGR